MENVENFIIKTRSFAIEYQDYIKAKLEYIIRYNRINISVI
jgi:hypothetical protein